MKLAALQTPLVAASLCCALSLPSRMAAETSPAPTPADTRTNSPTTPSNTGIPAQTDPPPAATSGTNANPFRQIPLRNGFGIKPPPPPPPPAPEPTPTAPPPPPANVTLTGFSVWQGRKKVYLQITTPGSKAPVFRDLEEGDITQEDIEIVSIDEKHETAKILNSGQEMILNFKDNGAKPAAGPVPGAPSIPGAIPSPAIAAIPSQANRAAGPTIIGRGGVTDSGSAPNAVPAPINAAVPVSDMGAAVPVGTAAPVLPSRRVRSDGSGSQPAPVNVPVLQPGQERVINGRLIPPPPPLPVFESGGQ